jgi:hypothetical protein
MKEQHKQDWTNAAMQARRLRIIDQPVELNSEAVTPDELRRRCVLFRAGVAGDDSDTVGVVERLLPWLEIWRKHDSWKNGAWRCVVSDKVEGPEYTAYRARHLDFHTDMSRYLTPPEFTIIRCLNPDGGGGGANLQLHIDDVFARLGWLGRLDILDMLSADRVLNLEPRHCDEDEVIGKPRTAALALPDTPLVPCRIFDRHAATKGSHLAMNEVEERIFDEFIQMCNHAQDLVVMTQLHRHDVLVFSNWRFMHARTRCYDSDRVTEVCMGDEAQRGPHEYK